MAGEGLGVTHVDETLDQPERVVELLAGFESSLDAEGQQGARAPAEIFLDARVVGTVREAGVVDPRHARVVAQELGDAPRVLDVALHAQRHRLDALQ